MAQTLASVAVGTVVKLNESGSPVEFIVAKQDYESGLNGIGKTLLVRATYYNFRNWDQNSINAYAASDIDSWLNTTYKNLLDEDISEATGTTKFYYTVGNWNNTVSTLERNIFLLSLTEHGISDSYANIEGSVLPTSVLPILLSSLTTTNYVWTRSPYLATGGSVWIVQKNGQADDKGTSTSCACRPCFTLPGSTTYVLDDGTITLNQPPSAPGSINVPTVAAGQPCAITWTAATDPDGTIASYILERSVNESGWEQIFQGNALTYTDTTGDWATVQYRVCAVDNYGAAGPYATSEVQTVQDGVLYISGPSPDMGQKVAPFIATFSTGVSGNSGTVTDISLVVTLDGSQIYTGTVSTGEEISLTIDTRVIGGGSHTITAEATKTDYISASAEYLFSTPSLSLPDDGLALQLQDDLGRPVFPQSVASLIGGLYGQSVAGNLQNLIPAVADLTANKVQIETGSYVGTGGIGNSSPNTLTFGFSPKFLCIIGPGESSNKSVAGFAVNNYGFMTGFEVYHSSNNTSLAQFGTVISWNGNSVSFYYDYGLTNPDRQFNVSGATYNYLAIG